MPDDKDKVLTFGFPEEWEKFRQRHPQWVERFQNIANAVNTAFTRIQTMEGAADKLVYFYGRMCAEDFMEILLVCGNGYGAAALKLVRSMYEHAVTLRYLHEHPEEVENFMLYSRVQQYKLTKPIFETFGRDVLPPETVARVERQYEEVKERFRVTACDCGARRVNHTWSKLDFVAMAKKTGALGTLILPGYYLPLRHAHSTFGGLTERMEIVEGRMGFQTESQPELADRALMTAHNCLLNAIEVQKERFSIPGLEEQLQTCFRNYIEIWKPDSDLLKDTGEAAGAASDVSASSERT